MLNRRVAILGATGAGFTSGSVAAYLLRQHIALVAVTGVLSCILLLLTVVNAVKSGKVSAENNIRTADAKCDSTTVASNGNGDKTPADIYHHISFVTGSDDSDKIPADVECCDDRSESEVDIDVGCLFDIDAGNDGSDKIPADVECDDNRNESTESDVDFSIRRSLDYNEFTTSTPIKGENQDEGQTLCTVKCDCNPFSVINHSFKGNKNEGQTLQSDKRRESARKDIECSRRKSRESAVMKSRTSCDSRSSRDSSIESPSWNSDNSFGGGGGGSKQFLMKRWNSLDTGIDNGRRKKASLVRDSVRNARGFEMISKRASFDGDSSKAKEFSAKAAFARGIVVKTLLSDSNSPDSAIDVDELCSKFKVLSVIG